MTKTEYRTQKDQLDCILEALDELSRLNELDGTLALANEGVDDYNINGLIELTIREINDIKLRMSDLLYSVRNSLCTDIKIEDAKAIPDKLREDELKGII